VQKRKRSGMKTKAKQSHSKWSKMAAFSTDSLLYNNNI